ncbi:hypothetical protein N7G274_007710 [Stereocaulon virgatum]|uniref:NADH:flavin oxidoreductase/NADH oxidase N-terminal domain-containing protein n=1 Tax=Stereocaulon virgatum TaxID=373712 RepID=A0ABR4A319_9LECA
MSTPTIYASQAGPALALPRIAMGPFTRYRANAAHVHIAFAIEYYSQRASVPGTLLLTKATFISPHASGQANVPGICNAEQIKVWESGHRYGA